MLRRILDLLNNSLGGLRIGYDNASGKYGYWKKEADTDVFVPFKGNFRITGHINHSVIEDGVASADGVAIFTIDVIDGAASISVTPNSTAKIWGNYYSKVVSGGIDSISDIN